MRQSSASAARVSCSLPLEPEPERMRLQGVVTNVPRLTVPSFALAPLKTGDFSEIRLFEQDKITPMRRSLNALRLYIICSCASGPAVNADWATLPGASAEGSAVSRISGKTSENCTTRPRSNSRDRASSKSPPSSPRKERRRDITAAKEIKCKVESFTAERSGSLILSRTSTETGGRGSQKPVRKKNLVSVLLFQLRFGRAS